MIDQRINKCRFVASRWFRSVVTTLVCLNALVLGLYTIPAVKEFLGVYLYGIDRFCLACFVIEMILKLWAYRWRFFKVGWNCFDLTVIVISLLPQFGVLSSIRLFRYLRVLRLITSFRQLRIIVMSVVRALPGIGWTAVFLFLIYYVYAIIGVNLYGQNCPNAFGTLTRAFYSLFQLMTLDGWRTDIVDPVVATNPSAWWYFISFIILSAFVLMNVVIGIFVNSMNETVARTKSKGFSDTKIEEALSDLSKRLERIENKLDSQDVN